MSYVTPTKSFISVILTPFTGKFPRQQRRLPRDGAASIWSESSANPCESARRECAELCAALQLVGAFAEFERTMIRQPIKAGLKRAVAQGVKLGRPMPREMKVEHSRGVKEMTDEQIERSIELIKEMLAQREAGANAKVVGGVAEPARACARSRWAAAKVRGDNVMDNFQLPARRWYSKVGCLFYRPPRTFCPASTSPSMPSAPLTSHFVRGASCPAGRAKVDFFDADQKGFLLEVRSSGGKTFYQRYIDAHGRQRQFKIGPADVLSVERARRMGRSAHASALLGADPQARRQELRSIPTLNQLVHDRYLPHAQANKRSWKTDEYLLRIHILPAIGRFALDEITSERIADLVAEMRSKGYTGGTTNRVLALLSHVFNLARKWNVAGASVNPTTGLATAPEVHRQRFLLPEETQRLIASINADQNQIAAKAIMLLLLTGARRGEIIQAKWEHVDLEKRILLVPVAKSGRPRTVALNATALALLKSIPRDPTFPYVFPTRLVGLFYPWNRIRRRAGLPDVRLHDLRHSFASFLVNQGVSLYVVQGLLGHASPRMTQRYAHLAPQTLLEAAEVVAGVIRGPRDADREVTEARQAESE